jgi:serine/threonine protein kinase/tetratricopeptide (TPR) repeat protein
MAVDVQRAKSLFLAASDLADPAERAAFLYRECGGNADLRARVEALLRANDAAPLPAARQATVDSAPGQPQTGDYADPTTRVGAILAGKYKLFEEIGEGGMGRVFMAQQTEPVKRAVAIKVIKAGMDSRAVLARFEAERQALAMMDHPNIAKVLDAGTTDGGRPFFVMELVKGTPITRYCDEHKLTPRQRLELFVPVCQAIQHAHTKGVIHRDVKPSNVLVALYDDRPVPKVIDFGVAKAAGQALTDKTLMTGFGALVGTPEYMSPEQASLNNLDIDTRSDVYSLGVLLYELLTGTTPVDKKSLAKAALLEVLRIVREVEAVRPSAKLSTIDTLPSVAANRGTEPVKLSRLMKGELDWLVMKALEKDRTRRYETVNALSRDIQRYLADDVVEARPPSVGYRVSKFVRRHKGQVLAASLVLVTLVAGVIGTTLGMLRANRAAGAERIAKNDAVQQKRLAEQAAGQERQAKEREKERAQGERQAKLQADAKRKEAERNLAFAKKGNEILGSVFAGLAPKANYATVAELRNALRDNLNKAVKDLDGSAIGEPLEVAEMQVTLGLSLLGLGEASRAVEVFQKALATREAKLGRDHVETLSSMHCLALAYKDSGQLAKAVRLYEEVLPKYRAKLGPDHLNTLACITNLALAYQASGRPAKALPLLEEALEKAKARYGPDHPSTLLSRNNMAAAYEASGRIARAVPFLEETLAKAKATLGPDHPYTFAGMDNLAKAYLAGGQFAKAVTLFAETVEKTKATLGPDHPYAFVTMNNLASAYQASGRIAEALPLIEQVLEKQSAKLGPDHPGTLITMHHLAVQYQASGQIARAVPLFEQVLEKQSANPGRDHPDTLYTMSNLALAYMVSGQVARAVPLLEQALEKQSANLGPDNPYTLSTMRTLALAYQASGQVARAVPLLEQVLEKQSANPGRDHPDTLFTMRKLALAYQASGQIARAVPLLEETLAKKKAQLGAEHAETLGTMAVLGLALLRRENWTDAEPLLRELLAIRQKQIPDGWLTFNAQSMLGGALLGQKKYPEAEPLLVKGYEGMKTREPTIPKVGDGDLRIPEALDRLIELYTATNNPDEANKWQVERAKYPNAKVLETKK